MKKRTPSWDDLMTLAVLARMESYSACARELKLTHVTVIRRIQRLEHSLGMKLLDRGETGLRLTDAGTKALDYAERMEGLSHQLLREIDVLPSGPSGKIRVTATEAIGVYLLAPHLQEFRQAYPRIEIELILEGKVLSIARRKSDVAIRLARPMEPELIAKKAGEIHFGLYCSEDRALAAGARNRVCKLDPQGHILPECEWADRHLGAAQTVFSSTSLPAVSTAVASGLGCGVLPHYLAQRMPSLRCVENIPSLVREVWIAYPQEYRSDAKYRPFIEWLANRFATL